MPVVTVMTMRMRKIPTLFPVSNASSFPDKLLNAGRNTSTIQTAKIREKKDRNKDSPKNWLIIWPLLAPDIFRIPTSFALLAA